MSTLDADPLLTAVPDVDGYKSLDPCLLIERVGEGGMGAVYRAVHVNFDREVAVKVLRPDLANTDPSFIARFRREAVTAATVVHENLIQVFEVNERYGLHYIVMEFVMGETVRDRVRRKGPLSVGEACTIVLAAARGLGRAHGKGVVHRDVKPDNILVSADGDVKVADLGLAKNLASDEGLTSTRVMMGTPQFTPPEQWNDARDAGPASDVWALGATLWFLLVGRSAIEGGPPLKVGYRIVNEPFPDLDAAREGLPLALTALVAKATQNNPEDRHPDAGALARDLEGFLHTEPPTPGLADPAAGARFQGRTVVSPPPRPVAQRSHPTLPAPKAEGPIAATALATSWAHPSIPGKGKQSEESGPRPRPGRWLLVAAAVVVAGLGFWWFLRGSDLPAEPRGFGVMASEPRLEALAPAGAFAVLRTPSLSRAEAVLGLVAQMAPLPLGNDGIAGLLKPVTSSPLDRARPALLGVTMSRVQFGNRPRPVATAVLPLGPGADPTGEKGFRKASHGWSVFSDAPDHESSDSDPSVVGLMLDGDVSVRIDGPSGWDAFAFEGIDDSVREELQRIRRGSGAGFDTVARELEDRWRDVRTAQEGLATLTADGAHLVLRAELVLESGAPGARDPLLPSSDHGRVAAHALPPHHTAMVAYAQGFKTGARSLVQTLQAALRQEDEEDQARFGPLLRTFTDLVDSFRGGAAASAHWSDPGLEVVLVFGADDEERFGARLVELVQTALHDAPVRLQIETQKLGGVSAQSVAITPDHLRNGDDEDRDWLIRRQRRDEEGMRAVFGTGEARVHVGGANGLVAIVLGPPGLAEGVFQRLSGGELPPALSAVYAEAGRDAAVAGRVDLRSLALAMDAMARRLGETSDVTVTAGPPAEVSLFLRQDGNRIRMGARAAAASVGEVIRGFR